MSQNGDRLLETYGARCLLMLDVTCHTLRSDPDLRLCEGLRLIEATHAAIGRLAPASLGDFEARILPQMRSILMERFGVPELPRQPVN